MVRKVEFYRVNEPYGCFSNFSKHPVFIGSKWPTCEHYFQGQKFLDSEIQVKIIKERSPMKAAQMGRNRNWPLRVDWEAVKDDIMRTGVKAKVLQHHDVRETLLGTGDALIVEHTSNDAYWGDGGDGSGKNMLGKILMEVRDELTKDGPYDELADMMEPPWLKHPELDRHSMGWRMGYGEEYLLDFVKWYGGLSPDGKAEVRARYYEPEEWAGFFDRR